MEAPEAITSVAHIPERASAAACFGTPASAGERTVIPVAEISYGLGMGWGTGTSDGGGERHESEGSGGGAGGGSRMRGVAVIELAPDGVRVHPIVDQTKVAQAGIMFGSIAFILGTRTLRKLIRG